MAFKDVRVIAGDTEYPPGLENDSGFQMNPANARYRNLVWANLPHPDILFNLNTPTIVSPIKIFY